jgi:antitoxin PrlF
MATTLTITAKGQVTFRKELLRHLGVGAGDKVAVDFLPEGRVEIRSAKVPASIDGFIGCLRRANGKMLLDAEIAKLAAEGWAGRR